MKIAILGSKGQLGSYLLKILREQKYDVQGYARPFFDINNLKNIKEMLKESTVIINAIAYTNTVKAELDEQNHLVNFVGVKNIVDHLQDEHFFIHISSHVVYKSDNLVLCQERDLNKYKNWSRAYAKAKWMADKYIMENASNWMIACPSWLHGSGPRNYINKMQKIIDQNKQIMATTDDYGQFTSANMIFRLIKQALDNKNIRGFYNVACSKVISRYDLLNTYKNFVKLDVKIIKGTLSNFNLNSQVVNFSLLNVAKVEKIVNIGSFQDELYLWIKENQWKQ